MPRDRTSRNQRFIQIQCKSTNFHRIDLLKSNNIQNSQIRMIYILIIIYRFNRTWFFFFYSVSNTREHVSVVLNLISVNLFSSSISKRASKVRIYYCNDLTFSIGINKRFRESSLVRFHSSLERVLLGTLKITDLPYPAFDPLGQNEPENSPAFSEKSSGEQVLNSHDRTMTDPTACGLHTQQWFPRHVMPTWVNCGPYLQNFPIFQI